MIWLLLILGLLALLVAAPYVIEALKPRMDERARRSAPGKFADLSRGRTHYRWLGATRGPVAVCVHGLTTPSFVWNGLTPGLGALGFRVLIYDLYGRGYSDRPSGPQDSAFFVTQLEELLEDQGIDGDITLLGYSMGGSVATAFAALFPERLRQLVLIAPAGLGHDLGPLAERVSQGGSLGRWAMQAFFARSFREGTEAERDLPISVEGIVDLQQGELRYRGFVPAVIASINGMVSEDLREEHRDISQSRVPVLAIWGREDTIIPLSSMGDLAQLNRAARQEVIEGAGHGLTYTHSDEVIHAMRDLMRD
ncbi:Pimeloyl-ACP methyl ester carboxylesterase [Roseovarius marisflavi]|uniref:Pimeloyl-ACP methyl ester carboxylesterase n=1 Tax=Roseovarius marisflavi TaxID=1054996 RepID=A0A1M6ZCP3_9RHOB|nr:alpha/beta hydrolase [Roseovarius marisflavi]SHL28248.1 Pimeloyl-ACP methyl ester carboxylesterase [Roseovarius marisflavi]